MKVFLNFIKGTLISIWVVVAIFCTVCLMSYNEFGVSEFGDYTLFVIDNRSLEPTFNKNDIVIVRKDIESRYNVNDTLFFYYGNRETRSYVNMAQVTNIERLDRVEDNFIFDDLTISYGNIIGNANGSMVIRNLGIILNLLESRWGFMFLIILPTIFAVCYEVYVIYNRIKKDMKRELAAPVSAQDVEVQTAKEEE